ncbi:hypothetical protein RF11_14097 [Thelohanellus kitauei]|uniref:Uncharacterized protein n=1 Tax=Thelohanellus kitauei TaxID=669202 RepID=A0A0C2NFA4_THEKT|nr:hypothetical protein RF11_14097 [Thelohanellus kitauei]
MRDHKKQQKDFPTQNRIKFDEEMEYYKLCQQKEKTKATPEMIEKKQRELLEWIELDNETKIKKQNSELVDFDKDNEIQMQELQDYHAQKNEIVIKYYQDLINHQCVEDESEFMKELTHMYLLKKNLEIERENEINKARTFSIAGIPNISEDIF